MATVADGMSQPFTASATDQFGQALAGQPALTWSVDPGGVGGTVNASGLYTAPASGGSDTVRATSGAVSGTAAVTVAASSTSASFVATDTTTQGNWRTAYGGDRYDIAQDTSGANPSLPSYAQLSLSGQANYTWGMTFPGLVPLVNSAGSGTIAACWYASTSFNINLSLSGGQTHQVALYVTNAGTSERFDVMDSATGVMLNSEVLASSSGSYLVWNLKGNVTIRVTNVGPGANAVVNGIFFGSASAASTSSASFAGLGATTQGKRSGPNGAACDDISQQPSADNITLLLGNDFKRGAASRCQLDFPGPEQHGEP